METVNIYDAKTRLSQLVDKAASGEDVVVSRNGKPLVRITRLEGPKRRIKFGVLKGKVKIVGWDASATEIKDLQDGTISDLVLQNPFKMGYDSVKAMVNQLRNHQTATTEDTGVTFVSATNLNDAAIQAALTPTCANQTT